jgi:hypothetical protein
MAADATTLRASNPDDASASIVVNPDTERLDAGFPGSDGRIALTIGVTGHRHLVEADLAAYRQRIEELFDDLHVRYPHTPLRVLSPLAEGADRLPVEIALARGYDVVAVLPLSADDYERDFADRVSAFRELIARIPPGNVFVLPAIPVAASFVAPGDDDAHRNAHYEQAGDFVASHCHVLLALWDGVANDLPGGTGEVVHYKLTGRGPHQPSIAELLELPDGGPVAWLKVRRMGHASSDASFGALQWLYPADRDASQFEAIYRQVDGFNALAMKRPTTATSALIGNASIALDHEQRAIASSFATADALSIHYRKVGDRVLKVLVALGIVMTLAYEAYSRLLPIRAMLGLYLGAFALVCVVYVWHRRIGGLQKHLDYRALAEGLRVRFFWSLAGIRTNVTDVYLRKQNDDLQWIREALRPATPTHGRSFTETDLVHRTWLLDQVAYFGASARRLNRTGRWTKLASLGFFAVGLIKTAALFVLWNDLDDMGGFGHWSVVTVGSLPIVGALIDALSDSMGYGARSKQHAILAGIFSRAADAYARVEARAGDRIEELRLLLAALGREALFENEDWLTLRRDRPMVLPPELRARPSP